MYGTCVADDTVLYPNLAIMSVYLKLPSLTSVLWAVQLTALGCS